MSLPSLHPPSHQHSYIKGDVTIHPSAVIGSGVILQATPGSKIIIAAGVCIGMGTIIDAHQGTLKIEEGANLGAGVLIVGQGTIGAHVCIGSLTTLFNSSIEPDRVIPPGSVIGDTSRKISQLESAQEPALPAPDQVSSELLSDSSSGSRSDSDSSLDSNPDSELNAEETSSASVGDQPVSSDSAIAPSSPDSAKTRIHGQDYVNQLIYKLLPNRPGNSE